MIIDDIPICPNCTKRYKPINTFSYYLYPNLDAYICTRAHLGGNNTDVAVHNMKAYVRVELWPHPFFTSALQ
jgi:hypothetical protein